MNQYLLCRFKHFTIKTQCRNLGGYLKDLYHRHILAGGQPYVERSAQIDWNYSSEISAFANRIGNPHLESAKISNALILFSNNDKNLNISEKPFKKSTQINSENNSDSIKKGIPRRKKLRVADVKDKLLTFPNGLSLLRICSTPFIGFFVVTEHYIAACGLFVAAGITDLLDGYIARTFPTQKSMVGSILDPLADKFLISTLFITLAYSQLIPISLTAIVLSRDIILIIGSLIKRYQLLEPPITVSRFFDTSVSSVKITPTFISKVGKMVTLSLASPVFGFENHPILMGLWFTTAGTTIYSGFQYATRSAMIPAKLVKLRKKK